MRVLVIARRPLTRAGLKGLLMESSLDLSGEVSSIEQASLYPSDVLLAELPDELNDEWLQAVESLASSQTYLVILGDPTQLQLKQMIEAGVRGVLSSTSTPLETSAALQGAAKGLLVLDPKVTSLLFAPQETQSEETGDFTEREREVLEFLGRGWPNRMIANQLRISEHTVKFHVASLLQKLGASSRTEAVSRAVRKGFIAL
jgi:DNA-binding NarL/FixJ family response regulator